MRSGPCKTAEAIVALLTPPACREEVVGDLHERYRGPLQYSLDALEAVPLVIVSRIRRTADPQVLVMQAFALYGSFLGAVWFQDGALLHAPWGLLRLALPAAITLLGLVIDDAYAMPGQRSWLKLVRGPVLGIGFAFLSQGMLWTLSPSVSVPRWVMLYGGAMSLLLSSTLRMLFPPAADQLQGASAPAAWLKLDGGLEKISPVLIRVLKVAAAVITAAILGRFIVDFFPLQAPRVLVTAAAAVALYQIGKRVQ